MIVLILGSNQSHASFIYLHEPDQLSSDPLKPEDVGFQHLQSIEPRLRRLVSVFHCCSACEMMKDYKTL